MVKGYVEIQSKKKRVSARIGSSKVEAI